MKLMKKLTAVLLAVFLAVPMFGIIANAAEGTLMFSDPETKVGETVSVDLVVRTQGEAIGDADITMSYDTAALEFISGEGVEADGSGSLSYFGSGTGSESELRTTMQFRALTAGETTITVTGSTAYLYSDETLNLEEGSSAIQIAAADDGSTSVQTTDQTEQPAESTPGETTDITVDVNGTQYNFSEAFANSDLPSGYTETTLTFNGEERKFGVNEAGVYLGYLVDSAGTGRFFLYNEEDATFSPYVELSVSDTTSIIPLNEEDAVSLPSGYQQVEMTILDQTFPVWSKPGEERFYVMYALNTRTGEKTLYQYDTEDGTYQMFQAPAQEEEKKSDSSMLDRIGSFIGGHVLIVLIAAAALFLILFILMIVFAVKLVHRNQELDDLYDEYDIPFEDEEEKPAVQKKSRSQFAVRSEEAKPEAESPEEEEEILAADGGEYYDDDDGYYDEDEYYDEEDDYYDDDDDELDDYYDDEADDDEIDDDFSGDTADIGKRENSSDEEDDNFKVDFIDL